MIILGIDPGIATLGYGVIEKDERGNCRAVDCGVITTPKEEGLPVRLAMLEEGIAKILEKYHPDEVAMEELFFSKNKCGSEVFSSHPHSDVLVFSVLAIQHVHTLVRTFLVDRSEFRIIMAYFDVVEVVATCQNIVQ